MNDDYTVIILLTLVGFCALAFLLLAPVYLFLKREKQAGEQWTRRIREQQMHQPPPTNGASKPGTEDETP